MLDIQNLEKTYDFLSHIGLILLIAAGVVAVLIAINSLLSFRVSKKIQKAQREEITSINISFIFAPSQLI